MTDTPRRVQQAELIAMADRLERHPTMTLLAEVFRRFGPLTIPPGFYAHHGAAIAVALRNKAKDAADG